MHKHYNGYGSAFTIVELLVVIVVIGILASITIISYSGISSKATIAAIQSDLSNSYKYIGLYQAENGYYPDSLDLVNQGNGIKISSGATYQYSYDNSSNPQTFCLAIMKSDISHKIIDNQAPTEGDCLEYGLIGYWPMDEGLGLAVQDLSGAPVPHNGTMAGTASWVSGKSGQAINFDGSGYVNLGNYSYDFPNESATISAWVNSSSTTERRTILTLGNNSFVNIQFELGFGGPAGGGSYYVGLNITSAGKAQSANSVYTNNAWHHMVYTKNPAGQHIYVNGIEVPLSGSNVSYVLTENAANKYIGQRAIASQPFIGVIDELRLYDRALSESEVLRLYNKDA